MCWNVEGILTEARQYPCSIASPRRRAHMLHRMPTNLIRLTLSSLSPHVGGPSWELLCGASNQSRVPPKPIANPIGWGGSSEVLKYFKECKYLSHIDLNVASGVTCDALWQHLVFGTHLEWPVLATGLLSCAVPLTTDQEQLTFIQIKASVDSWHAAFIYTIIYKWTLI